jgi:hypothetical protein
VALLSTITFGIVSLISGEDYGFLADFDISSWVIMTFSGIFLALQLILMGMAL